jgi:broad specificity phosphatase PhoE
VAGRRRPRERLDGDLVVLTLDQLPQQCRRWVLNAEGLQHDAVEDGEPLLFLGHSAQRLAVALVRVMHAGGEGLVGVVQPQPREMGVDGHHLWAFSWRPLCDRGDAGDRALSMEVTMAVDVVFETHSLTTDNEAGVATGWLDGQLSERGRTLARQLGRRRRNDGVAAVFASDLGRTVETVELAFGGSGIPVHLDTRLRECDYGAWNGMPVSRLERERTRRISREFPDGESYLQVVGRVAGFLEELARDWDRARVLVVGHSATRWALDHLLNGAALHDLMTAPFAWQEGWSYALPAGWRRPGLVAGSGDL